LSGSPNFQLFPYEICHSSLIVLQKQKTQKLAKTLENNKAKGLTNANQGVQIHHIWHSSSSEKPFLWIIRPDLVASDSVVLSPNFVTKTKERGVLASWCPQEEILKHPSIEGFLTHSRWNSTLESVCGGVPIISYPFLPSNI
jgi:hypothetical protein